MDDELKDYLAALGARIKARRKECKLNMRDIMIATGYYLLDPRPLPKSIGLERGLAEVYSAEVAGLLRIR